MNCCDSCNRDATVTNPRPAIATATVATALVKGTPVVKPYFAVPRTSTGVSGKTTSKTSVPAKNTR